MHAKYSIYQPTSYVVVHNKKEDYIESGLLHTVFKTFQESEKACQYHLLVNLDAAVGDNILISMIL